MGTFRFEYEAVGGHGCDRNAKPGEGLKWCGNKGCPDCAVASFVAGRRGQDSINSATVTHWPNDVSEVVDDVLGGTRVRGEFGKSRPVTDHVEQFFGYTHLPPEMRAVSKLFAELANKVITTVPGNQERTKALNKLLEAKDCAVRALIAKPVPPKAP